MRRIAMVGSFALMLGACASLQTQRPAEPPPLTLVTHVEAQAEPTPVPPTGAELLAQQLTEVREAIKMHAENGRWPMYKTDREVLYAYDQGPAPVVACEPLRTTDIQLQGGETITDVAMGDTERWMATPASSGDPSDPVPHLAVKPQGAAISTNLTIYTTKHIYHLSLRSRPGHAMQEVEFYYPNELLDAMKKADATAAQAKAGSGTEVDPPGAIVPVASVDPGQLNFSYTISGPQMPWKPVRAFDDGTHVYIQMPAGMKSSEAPALMVAAGSGSQMVNYRVRGDYYVVDRLFDQAVLVAGVGRQQDRETIAYSGNAR
jgi:P-type conjugative transfer protein TrbG